MRPKQDDLHFTYHFQTRFFFKRQKNHCNLFLRVQLNTKENWFRQWLGAEQTPSHCLSQWSMVHICVSRIDWVDYITVFGKYIDAEKNGTVWVHEGDLHSHIWKWAIPTRQVRSGRGTGGPYIVISPISRMVDGSTAWCLFLWQSAPWLLQIVMYYFGPCILQVPERIV